MKLKSGFLLINVTGGSMQLMGCPRHIFQIDNTLLG